LRGKETGVGLIVRRGGNNWEVEKKGIDLDGSDSFFSCKQGGDGEEGMEEGRI